MKATIFHNKEHTNIIISKPDITPEEYRENLKHIHTTITSQYLNSRKNNKITNTTPYDIHLSEQILPRHMRAKLPQLRANKSPLSQSYLHTVYPETYTPQCSLCLSHIHDTQWRAVNFETSHAISMPKPGHKIGFIQDQFSSYIQGDL